MDVPLDWSQPALRLIYEHIAQRIAMDGMYIARYDKAMDAVFFELVVSHTKSMHSGYTPRSGGAGRTEAIISTKKSILHRSRAEAEAWYAKFDHEEYVGFVSSSWIGVPILRSDEVLGVIAVYVNGTDYVYDERNVRMLEELCTVEVSDE